MDNTKELQLLSFCTGYGGIERGLELAGVSFRTITHVEIEAFAIANLVAKMENEQMVPAPIWTNVKTLPLEIFRDRVDILTGGYPCQPFSVAGKRKGSEDPRHLFPYILKAIDVIRPGTLFFENVEGHINLGLREVIGSLEIRGYKTTWGIFSASEVGAPHQRKRVFIMAKSDNCGYRKDRKRNRESCEIQGKHRKEIRGGVLNRASEELGNSESWCDRQLKTKQQRGNTFRGSSEKGGNALSNPMCERLQRRWRYAFCSKKEFAQYLSYCKTFPRWRGLKSRNWENPRLKPRLGRTTDGIANKVDRLRLLGNGVVPQTAALAWKILNERNK